MGKGIPDRWLDYSNYGRVIKGTRFIALKVPLHALMQGFLPAEEQFTISDVVQIQNLGHVIDLTFTDRYYKPHELEEAGVKHTKIKTMGHAIPHAKVVKRFYYVVDKYFQEEPEKIVGVHCTHGLNRTGYLVCRYMIEKLGFEPNDAINEFNSARGHEQERANYIQHLKSLKGGQKSNQGYDSWRNDMSFNSRRRDEQESNIPHKKKRSGNRPPDRSSVQYESNTPHFYSAGNFNEPRGNYDRRDQLEKNTPNLRFHRNNDEDFSRNKNRNQNESKTPHFYSAGNCYEPRRNDDRHDKLEKNTPNLRFHRNNDEDFSRNDSRNQQESNSNTPHFYSAGNCYEPRGKKFKNDDRHDKLEKNTPNLRFHRNNDRDFCRNDSRNEQESNSNTPHFYSAGNFNEPRGNYDRRDQLEKKTPNLRFQRNNDEDFSRNKNRNQNESKTPHFYSAGNCYEPRRNDDKHDKLEKNTPNLRFHRNNDGDFSGNDSRNQQESNSNTPHFYSAGNFNEPRGNYDRHGQLEKNTPNPRFHRNNDRDFSGNDNKNPQDSNTPHFYSTGNCYEPRRNDDRHDKLEKNTPNLRFHRNNDGDFSGNDNRNQNESKIPHFFSDFYFNKNDSESGRNFGMDKSKSRGSKSHGSKSRGFKSLGSNSRGSKSFGSKSLGSKSRGSKSLGYKSRGSKRDNTSRISKDKTKQQDTQEPSKEAGTSTNVCDKSTENEKKITGDNSNVESEPFQRQHVVVEKNKFFTQPLFSI